MRFARYNAEDEVLVKDLPSKSRDLMRRFALVERAKDASIVGIVVGTLGVAGYNEAIQRVREIVAAAGPQYSSYYICFIDFEHEPDNHSLHLCALAFPHAKCFVTCIC
jgi:diphthamide biosynthesis enzyme Dph1/Dph2-like protein